MPGRNSKTSTLETFLDPMLSERLLSGKNGETDIVEYRRVIGGKLRKLLAEKGFFDFHLIF